MTRRRISANASSCRGPRSGSPISSRASFGVRFTLIVTSMVLASPQAMKLRSSNATPSSFRPDRFESPAAGLSSLSGGCGSSGCESVFAFSQLAVLLTARRILPPIRPGNRRLGTGRTTTNANPFELPALRTKNEGYNRPSNASFWPNQRIDLSGRNAIFDALELSAVGS